MYQIIKFSLIPLLIYLGLTVGLVSFAQENITESLQEEVIPEINLDQEVTPENLDVKEPKLLPDNPFYFLKNWSRGIKTALTFDKVKKLELETKFANEKLIELKNLAEMKKDEKILEKGIENYKATLNKIKTRAEKIKEKAVENPAIDKFLDKFTKHQLLHQTLLQKLENQVLPEVFEKIKEVKEGQLEKFGEVMTKLEDRKEKIQEKLENALKIEKGEEFKNFQNLEILQKIEEKVPEEAKEAIKKAQENSFKRLKEDLEKMSPEDQEGFKEYVDKISGDKEKQIQILENIQSRLEDKPAIQNKLEETKKIIREKLELNIKDRKVCATLWEPVCGKNRKTYSNKCFAKLAEVEIAYQGECKEIACQADNDCPQTKCGPTGTIGVKCIGMKAKCVEGKCLIVEE